MPLFKASAERKKARQEARALRKADRIAGKTDRTKIRQENRLLRRQERDGSGWKALTELGSNAITTFGASQNSPATKSATDDVIYDDQPMILGMPQKTAIMVGAGAVLLLFMMKKKKKW